MQGQSKRRIVLGGAAVCVGFVAASIAFLDAARPLGQAGGPGRSAGPVAAGTWDTFRADLTIRQQVVSASGKAIQPSAPPVTFRLERTRARAGWRTQLTLKAATPPAIQGLTGVRTVGNPFAIVRMELDEDGSPLRMYNARGQHVPGPTGRDRDAFRLPASARDPRWRSSQAAGQVTRVVSRDWTNAMLVLPEARDGRRRLIERELGPVTGRLRGLDRFVATRGDVTREVLVDPTAAVPVEFNTARRGALASRTSLRYEPHGPNGLVRRALRHEQVLAGATGSRTVTDMDLANLSFTREGEQ